MKTTGARSTHQDMGVPGPHVAEPGREKKNSLECLSSWRDSSNIDQSMATSPPVFLRSGWKEIGGETLTLYTGTPVTTDPV